MQLKRSVLDCVNGIWGSEPENDGNDTIVIRVADFDRLRLSIVDEGFTHRKIDPKEKRSRLLRHGDLLLEKSGGGEKTLVGQVVLFNKDFAAVTSNFVAKMTPNPSFSGSYLNYVFSRFYSGNINYCSIKQNTGIQNLDSASYLSEKFGFPSLHEQQKIVAFLDYETAKIDALIEKQQRLIELLKEKRQAVISHAVTKGLNPNAPMKDSGVEWLGEVPAHWTVCRLKHAIKSGSSISYGIVQPGEPLDDGVPFVQTTNMSRGTFGIDDLQKTTKDIAAAYPRSTLEGGEVILGIRASIGAAYVVPESLKGVNLSRGVARIIPGMSLVSSYLVLFFGTDAVSRYWELSKQGSTFSEVSIETVREMSLLIPPKSEQLEIETSIKQRLSKMDVVINLAISKVSLLQERRTALISAAVTGKIDVRDWQAAA
ncbi:restriction endonuclease subunit S [Rhodoferax saidenbachensis]|nr:restriction endonuclease subunit S [Rhodoferax saidenbachensis]